MDFDNKGNNLPKVNNCLGAEERAQSKSAYEIAFCVRGIENRLGENRKSAVNDEGDHLRDDIGKGLLI